MFHIITHGDVSYSGESQNISHQHNNSLIMNAARPHPITTTDIWQETKTCVAQSALNHLFKNVYPWWHKCCPLKVLLWK